VKSNKAGSPSDQHAHLSVPYIWAKCRAAIVQSSAVGQTLLPT
jgi:hypothetical protein